jgi:thiamine biosynthesis protein ThiS
VEIEIILNGESKSIPSGLKLPDLLNLLGLSSNRVAIELNMQIVTRSLWPTAEIKPGDRIEIVHFVGGGASACEMEEVQPFYLESLDINS